MKKEAINPKQIEMEIRKHRNFTLCEWFFFENIGSTSDWAKEYCKKNPPNRPIVVSARQQTAGHGKRNRRWVGDCLNNIYLTIVFSRVLSREIMRRSAVLYAEKISHYFFHNYQIALHLKEPNDLLLHGRKIAGVLVELLPNNGGWLLSVGMNLFHDPFLQAQCSQAVGAIDALKILSPNEIIPQLCALAGDLFLSVNGIKL
ncbi:MAG: hypothetical protein LBG86_00925 [Puniceicoccales bacterium]|jgi:biotin-(acetyl-CoA carboxylase) ligase|nr:hypothetical protein [Puniceicoccales bacterium]